jgi:hypothetical protein
MNLKNLLAFDKKRNWLNQALAFDVASFEKLL